MLADYAAEPFAPSLVGKAKMGLFSSVPAIALGCSLPRAKEQQVLEKAFPTHLEALTAVGCVVSGDSIFQ